LRESHLVAYTSARDRVIEKSRRHSGEKMLVS
jgi:hypothetical protein